MRTRLAVALYAAVMLHGIALLAWMLSTPPAADELPEGEGLALEFSLGPRAAASPATESGAAVLAESPAIPASTPTLPASAPASVGGGRSYAARVRAHLIAHQPPQLRGNIGVVRLRFSVDARGRVSDLLLVASSGDAALDAEALALVRRAEPLPAPEDGEARQLTVPVEFF